MNTYATINTNCAVLDLKKLHVWLGMMPKVSKSDFPILQCALFDKGEIRGTDTEVTVLIDTGLPHDFSACIPVAALKALPKKGHAAMAVNGNKLQVSCDGVESTVNLEFTVLDFPSYENQPNGDKWSFSPNDKTFSDSVKAVSHAMPLDDVRYYLNGLLIESCSDEQSIVATDGHRLARVVLNHNSMADFQAIVPCCAVKVLKKAMGKYSGLIITGDKNSAVFSFDNGCKVKTKLVDAKYPDYARVIPSTSYKTVAFDIEKTLPALKAMEKKANKAYKGVRLSIHNGIVTVTANNELGESAECTLQAAIVDGFNLSFEGVKDETVFEIGFNVTYWIDAMTAWQGNIFTAHFTDSNSSMKAIIGDTVEVIMPMRL